MNAFIVDLKNKPGEFGKVAEAISAKGINISAFSGATCGDSGTAVLVTSDEGATREALTQGQWKYRPVELVTASLADRPGTLAEITKALGQNGVNIEAALPIGMTGGDVHIAFATDDPVKARDVLQRQPVGAHSR
jgi:hypothetical protein